MDNKLLIACCVFSFITGTYTAVMINQARANDNGCTVSIQRGIETHVYLGKS